MNGAVEYLNDLIYFRNIRWFISDTQFFKKIVCRAQEIIPRFLNWIWEFSMHEIELQFKL